MTIILHAFIVVLLIAGFLMGIRFMQSPRTALWGNRLGALCMILAIIFTLWQTGLLGNPLSWLCIGGGLLLGIWLGQTVRMIEMPQLVALLNGLGGLASAMVAGFAAAEHGVEFSGLLRLAAPPALAVGVLTFSGSVVAVAKLQGSLAGQSCRLVSNRHVPRSLLAAGVFVLVLGALKPVLFGPVLVPLIIVIFVLYGLLMALRVGGADMPILIALLNSFSGIAAAVCGLAVNDALLTGAGAMVGVAGLILTTIMCRAMNRNLSAVLGGFTTFVVSGASECPLEEEQAVQDTGRLPADVLESARKVIIVPGYGMAAAQAQGAVKELVDALDMKGKAVKIAVHPVAGRMPGHMNVLLAETGIDYERIFDLDVINPEFPETDLVIIIGACDVVNPAAVTAENTPIYGMPILNAEQAKTVIVCNRDSEPGYSGVANTLYGKPHVIALWGDAAETVPTLTAMLQGSRK